MIDPDTLDRRAFLRWLALTSSAGLLVPRTVFSKTTIVPGRRAAYEVSYAERNSYGVMQIISTIEVSQLDDVPAAIRALEVLSPR